MTLKNRFIPGTPNFVGYKNGSYALVRSINSPAIDHILKIEGMVDKTIDTLSMLKGQAIGIVPVKENDTINQYGLMNMPYNINEGVSKTLVVAVLPKIDMALKYINLYEGARRSMDNMRALLHSEFHKTIENELHEGQDLVGENGSLIHPDGHSDYFSGVDAITWKTKRHSDASSDFHSQVSEYAEELAFVRLLVEQVKGAKFLVVPSANKYATIRKDGKKVYEVLDIFTVDTKNGIIYSHNGKSSVEHVIERVAHKTGVPVKEIGEPVILETWADIMALFGAQEEGDDMFDVLFEPEKHDYDYPSALLKSLMKSGEVPKSFS